MVPVASAKTQVPGASFSAASTWRGSFQLCTVRSRTERAPVAAAEAVHHRADPGGGAGHAEGQAADGADRMRAPDLAARLVAGAQNGIARVGRRISVQDHARRLGQPQGGERPIGPGKNAGTRGRSRPQNPKPTVVPLPLKATGLLPETDNPMRPSAISPFSRAGKGASMRIANATSASVEALRSTFTALPGARISESSAKLRCRLAVSGLTETPPCFEVEVDEERIDTTVGRCPPAGRRVSADGS